MALAEARKIIIRRVCHVVAWPNIWNQWLQTASFTVLSGRTMHVIFRLLILLPAGVMAWAGAAGARSPLPDQDDSLRIKTPMVFYLAKGEPDACCPGCSKWIAAEGEFDQYTGTLLHSFLVRQHAEHLPIYFDSPGGLLRPAMLVGRLLRTRGMTAGVSRTNPDACAGADDRTCMALKQSGETLPAKLDSAASCSGACIYALIGAKVRQVPPGAVLGVRSGRLARGLANGGLMPIAQSPELEAARQELRRTYVRQMDVDPRLVDIESKVPFGDVHSLSREEIIEFGIDSR